MRVRSCDDINKRNGMGKKNEDKTTIGSMERKGALLLRFLKRCRIFLSGKTFVPLDEI